MSKTNIIHIALTPLAGAPIRIIQALNKYTDFNARLINLNPNNYGARTFPEDLVWEKDKSECLELISKADILHFHHYINLEDENNPFGVNFKKLAPNAKFLRHFHSDYDFIFKKNKTVLGNDPYPRVVIPHYPERTFLDTFIVPNLLPINDEKLIPVKTDNKIPKVFFSASMPYSMWHCRWNAKGVPEIKEKFKQLKKKSKFEFNIIENLPYEECLRTKQHSDIVIGDITSGSYHLTDLEALSQGKATFTYLDNRTQFVLQNLLQCDDLPFINTRIEEIDLPFIEIINNKKLQLELGEFSRNWIEKFYNEPKLVKFYEEVYTKLLNDEPIKRQNYLEFRDAKTFLYNRLYDLQWEQRKIVDEKKRIKIPKFIGHIICLFIFDSKTRKNFRARYL